MYHYEGEIIKLNEKDYKQFETNFPNLNLKMELMTLDLEFQHKPPKNWYVPMLKKLAYQERMAALRNKERKTLQTHPCLLYTSPSPRDGLLSRMPSSA